MRKRITFFFLFMLIFESIGSIFVSAEVPTAEFTNTSDISSWLSVFPYYISGSTSGHIATSGINQYIVNNNQNLPVNVIVDNYEIESIEELGELQLSPTETGVYKRYNIKFNILIRTNAKTSDYIAGIKWNYFDLTNIYSRSSTWDYATNQLIMPPETYDQIENTVYTDGGNSYRLFTNTFPNYGGNIVFQIETDPSKFTIDSKIKTSGGYYNLNGTWNAIASLEYDDTNFEGGLIPDDSINQYLLDNIVDKKTLYKPKGIPYISERTKTPIPDMEIQRQVALNSLTFTTNEVLDTPLYPKSYSAFASLPIYQSFEQYQTNNPYSYQFDPQILASNISKCFMPFTYNLQPRTNITYSNWQWKTLTGYQTTAIEIPKQPCSIGYCWETIQPAKLDQATFASKSAQTVVGFEVQNVYSIQTVSLALDIVAKYTYNQGSVAGLTQEDSDVVNLTNKPSTASIWTSPLTLIIVIGVGIGVVIVILRLSRKKVPSGKRLK